MSDIRSVEISSPSDIRSSSVIKFPFVYQVRSDIKSVGYQVRSDIKSVGYQVRSDISPSDIRSVRILSPWDIRSSSDIKSQLGYQIQYGYQVSVRILGLNWDFWIRFRIQI